MGFFTLLGAIALLVIAYTQLNSQADQPAVAAETEAWSAPPSPSVRNSPFLTLASQLGLSAGWQDNLQALSQLPEKSPTATQHKKKHKKTNRSVKIIFEFQAASSAELFYLVDIKRGATRKDHRWEFPGGRLDKDESIIGALVRELREEDPSLTLSDVVTSALQGDDAQLTYKSLPMPDGSHAYLLKTSLPVTAWERLQSYWHVPHPKHQEIYDFTLVPLAALDTRQAEHRDRWTPKSRKLLKALRQTE